ncbi:MAG: hypothetical protein M3O70_05840 [Actinomycetota bacterium]|nr:hypothetical protein [Actinomycetota bacterium]
MNEAPDPVAGPGQVVITVSVVDVLHVETQVRNGWGRTTSPSRRRMCQVTGGWRGDLGRRRGAMNSGPSNHQIIA